MLPSVITLQFLVQFCVANMLFCYVNIAMHSALLLLNSWFLHACNCCVDVMLHCCVAAVMRGF